MPVSMRLVSDQFAGLMTLTLSSSELSTNTGDAMAVTGTADADEVDCAREGRHAAIAKRHRPVARKRTNTFTKKNLSRINRLV